MADEKAKSTMKEKLMEKKTSVKNWISNHKKGLIKGGVIAGAIAVAGGAVAAVVNRCGLPSDCCSCDDEFVVLEELEFDTSDNPEECECSEEVKDE